MLCLPEFYGGLPDRLDSILFDEKTITPEWLVTCRLIASGSVILLGLFLKRRLEIFTIWKDKKDALHMIIYSVAGMMGSSVQLLYCCGGIKWRHCNSASIYESGHDYFISGIF